MEDRTADHAQSQTARGAISREIVTRLRGRSSGLRDAVKPLVDAQQQIISRWRESGSRSDDMLAAVLTAQDLLIDTLADRYDALDIAVHESELPFAEIDHAGRIVYANRAMARHVPQPERQDFASLFGARAPHVAEALRCETNTSLRLELERDGLPLQFRAEIGPLRDEDGTPGAYALLLGLRAEELRLDAALEGIMRVDLTGMITFANTKALELLNIDRERLLGTEASKWFRRFGDDSQHMNRQDPVSAWLSATAAVTERVELVTGTGSLRPVRVTVVPFYDGPDRQSGILITFGSIAEDIARHELRNLLTVEDNPRTVIRKAMQIVRGLIPCDLTTFGVYTDDMRQYRALVLEPEPEWHWGTRWFDVAPVTAAWLGRPDTWTNDLQAFASTYTPDQLDDPVLLSVQRDGLSRMVVLPIRGPGGAFRSALTLLSKDRTYGAEDLRILRDLGLEEVLLAAEGALERAKAICLHDLKQGLNCAQNARALARTLAQGVVKCFAWDYAGVFRVDRKAGEFVLFEQYDDTTDGSLLVKDDYRQKLSDGMLGHSYRGENVLVAPRVAPRFPGEVVPYNFIKTAASQRSAMIVPLRLNGRIELMLDIESSQENAFAGPDKGDAEELAADCEQIFARRWHEAIGHAVMDTIEQAAVIVDPTGTIRQINAAARTIFGEAENVPLARFGASADDRSALSDTRPRETMHVSLRLADDVQVPTLAIHRPLHDDYGHRIWLFTNLNEQRWERDWRYLDETVSEVARHTRAPLMIADGLLRGAAGLLRLCRRMRAPARQSGDAIAEGRPGIRTAFGLADRAAGADRNGKLLRRAGTAAPDDPGAARGRYRGT
jgi:PAS domain-containing protein